MLSIQAHEYLPDTISGSSNSSSSSSSGSSNCNSEREKNVLIMHLVNTQTDRKVTINQKETINCVQLYLGVQYIHKQNLYS